MTTSLAQIRNALFSYLNDNTGLASLPEDLLDLLEHADDEAKFRAEQIEGMLALYAGNKISPSALRDRLDVLSSNHDPVVLGKTLADRDAVVERVSTDAAFTILQKAEPFVLAGTMPVE